MKFTIPTLEEYPYRYPCPACKKDAFYLKKMPKAGDVLKAEDAMCYGSLPKPGDIICCQNCLGPVWPIEIDRIKTRK